MRVSNVGNFIFYGQCNGIRGPRSIGETVGHVVDSCGSMRRVETGGRGQRPVVLPSFSTRRLERAFYAELYRRRAGLGIVRSIVKRGSVEASVRVCTRTARRGGRRSFRQLTTALGMFWRKLWDHVI